MVVPYLQLHLFYMDNYRLVNRKYIICLSVSKPAFLGLEFQVMSKSYIFLLDYNHTKLYILCISSHTAGKPDGG